ncbi:spore germination protein [Alicyclobacillus sp. SO9]|uniref:spore germination protein n=1 Tax=Alicyclobacillus sp. SO9 TaxID=2665646 RepID=UPI0018E76999|nr:spore germination protein [Alicyclobacillus sp. SO9]QQE79658.1 spore germination protein [Alicyclobacillus sp. SO9]
MLFRKSDEPHRKTHENRRVSSRVATNEQAIQTFFQQSSDINIRRVYAGSDVECLLVYINGLTDRQLLDEVILKSLLQPNLKNNRDLEKTLFRICAAGGRTFITEKWSVVQEAVLTAKLVLFADGCSKAFVVDITNRESRAVEEPMSESVIRGPREGFVETLQTNTAILRRKIKSKDFKLEPFVIGQLSQTDVVLGYIDGIVNPDVLREVRSRISDIDIDAIISSHYIEEFIEDSPFSPYPQVQNTERPDVVVSCLIEGKCAILIDGDPFVLIVPMTFWSGFQAAEDYYERFIYTTVVRWLRFGLLNLSIFLTPTYVALSTYEPQMLPTNLILSFAAAREPSPFPTVIEAFLMEIVFEALREAGIRLPKSVGSAISIVGALVLGQTAVEAGLVDAPVVIMVATGGIASFATPRYNFGFSFRLLRFVVLLMAGMLGLLGIAFAVLTLLIHQVNLRSFGVPYMTPVAPIVRPSIQDALLRLPRWMLRERPVLVTGSNKKRIPSGQKPGPNRDSK